MRRNKFPKLLARRFYYYNYTPLRESLNTATKRVNFHIIDSAPETLAKIIVSKVGFPFQNCPRKK